LAFKKFLIVVVLCQDVAFQKPDLQTAYKAFSIGYPKSFYYCQPISVYQFGLVCVQQHLIWQAAFVVFLIVRTG
jgi:hypothetical protein